MVGKCSWEKGGLFRSVISVTYFSIWRPYVDQMVHCSWNYKVFAFHSLVSFHHSLLRYQPLQHYLHHLYLPSLLGIPVHILTKTYIQQAKVHFKYFIPTIRYGIMVNNNTLCFKKDVLMLLFKLEYRASNTKIRSFFC